MQKAMESLYGAIIEIDKNIFNYMSVDEDKVKAKLNIDKALKGEYIIEEEISGNSQFEQKIFEVSHSPIFDSQQSIIGVVVSAQDVSERKKIELLTKESEQQIRNLIEFSPYAIAYH